MQTQKKWLILGGLAIVVVVGLAVGLNQGGLFQGALTGITTINKTPTTMMPSAMEIVANNAGKAQAAGQSLSTAMFTISNKSLANPKTYQIMADEKFVGNLSRGKFDFSNAGVDRVYLKLEEQAQAQIPIPEIMPEVHYEIPVLSEGIKLDPLNESSILPDGNLSKELVTSPLLESAVQPATTLDKELGSNFSLLDSQLNTDNTFSKELVTAPLTDNLTQPSTFNTGLDFSSLDVKITEDSNLATESVVSPITDSMIPATSTMIKETDLNLTPAVSSPTVKTMTSPIDSSLEKSLTTTLRSAIPAARAADLAGSALLDSNMVPSTSLIDSAKLIQPVVSTTEVVSPTYIDKLQPVGITDSLTVMPDINYEKIVQTLSCTPDSSMVCEINVSTLSSGTYNIQFYDTAGTLIESFPVEIVAPSVTTIPKLPVEPSLPLTPLPDYNIPKLPLPTPTDTDGDGVSDLTDNCDSVANPNQLNSDGDTLGDLCDNCRATTNEDQADADNNGIGDACEEAAPTPTDTDGDGKADGEDNCPTVANATQTDSDNDSIGDACDSTPTPPPTPTDTDADGKADSVDNCPTVANDTQTDSDNDGIGDACDSTPTPPPTPTDADGDGKADSADNCPTIPNANQSDLDKDGIGDICDSTPVGTVAQTPPTGAYDYSYKYYVDPNQPAASVTKPSVSPCVVADKVFYLAGGPDSTYCKDLQSLVTAEGKQEIFQSDMVPETPQARYTTALATLRILRELGANIRTKNLGTDWYTRLSDSDSLSAASTQELADFRTVYASGILKGRINPKDPSDITLAPLGKVSYVELLAMFRQAIADSLGVSIEINEANLPAFIIAEYSRNPDWKWIAQAYSFGVDFDLISKSEFNEDTLFNYATRADMVRFLARFQDAVVANPSLLE